MTMVSKLDFDKFYRFGLHDYERPMSVAPTDFDAIPLKISERFFMGDFSETKPTVFVQRKIGGSRLCDIVSAGAPSFRLFSDRVINALTENGITGWGAYPVTIQTKKKGEITNYYAFYVTGRAEKADRSLCEKIEVTLPNGKQKIKDKGYYFPLDSWDGSDFFFNEGSYSLVTVTEKVKNLLESINATNVDFTRCSEYIWA